MWCLLVSGRPSRAERRARPPPPWERMMMVRRSGAAARLARLGPLPPAGRAGPGREQAKAGPHIPLLVPLLPPPRDGRRDGRTDRHAPLYVRSPLDIGGSCEVRWLRVLWCLCCILPTRTRLLSACLFLAIPLFVDVVIRQPRPFYGGGGRRLLFLLYAPPPPRLRDLVSFACNQATSPFPWCLYFFTSHFPPFSFPPYPALESP